MKLADLLSDKDTNDKMTIILYKNGENRLLSTGKWYQDNITIFCGKKVKKYTLFPTENVMEVYLEFSEVPVCLNMTQ